MDLDWCPCGKRLEGKGSYCSQECLKFDRFAFDQLESASSSEFDEDYDYSEQKRHRAHPHTHSSSHRRTSHRAYSHHAAQYDEIKRAFDSQQWPGHDRGNIVAWASEIPSGCGSIRPESLTYGSPKLRPPSFPLSRQRPVPPALCMSTTQTQSQSQSQHAKVTATPLAAANGQHRRPPSSAQDGSVSSLVSALTDSIATPMSDDAPNAAAAGPAVRSKTSVLDGLTARLGWSHAVSTGHQKQSSTKPQGRGFTVLSTTHITESDESDLFLQTKSTINAAALCREARGVTIVAKDAMYMKKERAPVSLKVERLEDHPAYRTRGRKAARAAANTVGGRL